MTQQIFTIPLTPTPQKFNITLAGRQLTVVNVWNEHSGWAINIIDGITNEPLISNIPLVTGADLLAQYEYVGIPGSLVVYTDGEQFTPPTETNLGGQSNLYYVVDIV